MDMGGVRKRGVNITKIIMLFYLCYVMKFLVNKIHFKKKRNGDWRDGLAIKNSYSSRNWILSPCVRSLTTACNSTSRGTNALLWSLQEG